MFERWKRRGGGTEDAVARDLVLASHHGPPEPLLGVGHNAQGQFLCDQALHEAFGIWKISLPSTGPAIRLRLCEMERAGHRRGAPGASASSTAPTPPILVANTVRSIP